jgi:hypothetical protein
MHTTFRRRTGGRKDKQEIKLVLLPKSQAIKTCSGVKLKCFSALNAVKLVSSML